LFSRIFALIEENRRWGVFFTLFFSGTFIIGINVYSFGLFIEPLEKEFGWTREQISLGYSLSFMSSLFAPLIGKLIDIKGSKLFLVISIFLVSTGFLLRPLMTDLSHWIILNSLVFAGYPGTLMIPAGILIQVWFPDTKGRMMGLATAGHNFGGLIMPIITLVLLSYFDWKVSYFVFGILIALLGIFALILVKNNPNNLDVNSSSNNKAGLEFRSAIKTRQFITLTLGITFACFTYNGIMPQMVPHLTTEGLGLASATFAMTYIGAMGILSKVIFGRFSEKYSSLYLTCISVLLQSLALSIILISQGNIIGIWLGIIIFGMGFAGLGAMIALNITECFGLKSLSTIWGALSFFGIWATFLAPWMMGRIFDLTSSYRLGHLIIIGIFLLAILFLLLTKYLNRGENYLFKNTE
tara:strand:+ start:6023 stop:7255 length:1233 start_codon:yes stop_codon:yes gene_type:complete